MTDPLFWHRVQFGFTITFHYLFPQLTMGLALAIVIFRLLALRGNQEAAVAARFWTRVFAVTFVVGVVTGIPMEFQFGTNWSRFSVAAGGVIGQTLAMEGMFAFFLESTFLGLVLYGEGKLKPRAHLLATFALFAGSWLSGYFIICTNAFMQHPVGYAVAGDGTLQLRDFGAFLFNEWAGWEYAHNMSASVVTAGCVIAGVGAFWVLGQTHAARAQLHLRTGVVMALVASVLQLFPTGDRNGKLVAKYQPAALAGMEGVFKGERGAGLALMGQPDLSARKLQNPVVVPRALSFLAYGSFGSAVQGLDDFPLDQRPDNVEILYYAYHIMVGIGTLLFAVLAAAAFQLWRGRLARTRWLLWSLMLAMPFPYIATTAGWMTAELGRQPWLVYGLLRTADGTSPKVGAGDTVFTLLGFCGLYVLLSIAFLFLVGREIAHGPEGAPGHHGAPPPAALPLAARVAEVP